MFWTIFAVLSLSNKLYEEYIKTKIGVELFTLYIHVLYIGGSLSFSNECCYFLNGSFHELANSLIISMTKNNRGTTLVCDTFDFIF